MREPACASSPLRLLRQHFARDDAHRNRAVREQIVVEGLQIERAAFLRLVLYEQRLDLRLPDRIVERLPRTKRKTAHFSLRRRAIDAGIRFEPCNRALEAPFSGCEFRIDESAS